MNTKKATDPEIEKDKLFEQFKSEAKTALTEFGFYRWQYESSDSNPSINRAIYFFNINEVDGFTIEDLLKEVLKQCDGKNNGNAKKIVIEYMSETIAHWETEAFLDEQQATDK